MHRHFGIIPDGARRWAQREEEAFQFSYTRSVSRILKLVQLAYQNGYDEVTVYCLSRLNLDRTAEDLNPIFEAIRANLPLLEDFISRTDINTVRIVGETDELPADLQAGLKKLKRTESGRALNLLMAYDSWAELNRAKTRSQAKEIKLSHFDISTPVEIIFRSAQGILLSGFLPFQSQYAHLVVSEKLFNDLTQDELEAVFHRTQKLAHQYGK